MHIHSDGEVTIHKLAVPSKHKIKKLIQTEASTSEFHIAFLYSIIVKLLVKLLSIS